MLNDLTWISEYFTPFSSTQEKFFGFSEFLTALALMIIAWSLADIRYKFRISVAPVPVIAISFIVTFSIGVLALVTEIWKSKKWLVLNSIYIDYTIWQFYLAANFLTLIFLWAWFAFIRPSKFSKYNAENYFKTLYYYFVKSSQENLSIIAEELSHSAKNLVQHAPTFNKFESDDLQKTKDNSYISDLAHSILELIADKRFCNVMVANSPNTIFAIFHAINDQKKYSIPIKTFANNIMNAAFNNTDSFMYHETEGYESGLMGYHRPISKMIFSNYGMVEEIERLFDIDYSTSKNWTEVNWEAYSRAILIVFESYCGKKEFSHSYSIYRAMQNLSRSTQRIHLFKIEKSDELIKALEAIDVSVKFIKSTFKILKETGGPYYYKYRQDKNSNRHESILDFIAEYIFDLISNASTISRPQWECWSIQHNSIWGELFNIFEEDSIYEKIIKFKLRRLIYNKILELNKFPNNFHAARILAFSFNVLRHSTNRKEKASYPLAKAVYNWMKKNYAWLAREHPRIAETCLVEGFSYDPLSRNIMRHPMPDLAYSGPPSIVMTVDP